MPRPPRRINSDLPEDDDRLDRLLAGEGSPADEAVTSDAEREVIDAVRAALADTDPGRPVQATPVLGKLWSLVRAAQAATGRAVRHLKLVHVPPGGASQHRPPARAPPANVWLPHIRNVAAAFVVCAVALGTFVFTRIERAAGRRAEAIVTVVAHRGERRSAVLPDGTHIVLAPESQLQYRPAVFGVRDRVVALIGQARFSVTHHDDRPFTVRAGSVVTRDVGTTFMVRAYPDEPARIAVAEGSVVVDRRPLGDSGGASASRVVPVLLTAGMAASTNGDHQGAQRSLTVGRADSSADFGWSRGSLVFHDAPLGEIAATLSRAYNIDLVVRDSSLRRARADAAFTIETPAQACAALALLVHGRCRDVNGVIELSLH